MSQNFLFAMLCIVLFAIMMTDAAHTTSDDVLLVEWMRTITPRTPLTQQKICYCLYGDVDDVGWSFRTNEARLEFEQWMNDRINVTVPSFVQPNVIGISDKEGNVQHLVEAHGCSLILANNRILLGNESRVAARFPDVGFVLVNDELVVTNGNASLRNLLYIGVRSDLPFYVAGAAAAVHSKSCLGFIAAWDDKQNSYDAANGFALGARSTNATITIHTIPMQNWGWPDAEQRAATVLARDFGCDVIARYTDSREVDTFVARSLRTAAGNMSRLASIGIHAELERYIGDSVMFSIFVDWLQPFQEAFVPWLFTGNFNVSTGRSYLYNAKISPVSRSIPDWSAVDAARSTAEQFIASRDSIFCGSFTNSRGETITHRGTPPNNCFSYFTPLGSFLQLPGVTLHSHWVDTASCTPGEKYEYAKSVTSPRGVCVPCPENTFATIGGVSECTPCPEDAVAAQGSDRCYPRVPASVDEVTVPVLASLLSGVLLVFAVVLLLLRRRASQRTAFAPRSPPLTLICLRIPDLPMLFASFPNAAKRAVEIFNDVLIREVSDSSCYLVSSAPDDTIVVAADDIVNGAIFAVSLQRALQRAQWPPQLTPPRTDLREIYNGLVASCSLHYCDAKVSCIYDPLRQVYSYSGSDVEDATDLVEIAPQGCVALTNATLKQLRAAMGYRKLIAPEVHVAPLVDPHLHLQKSERVFRMVPKELQRRGLEDGGLGLAHASMTRKVPPVPIGAAVAGGGSSATQSREGGDGVPSAHARERAAHRSTTPAAVGFALDTSAGATNSSATGSMAPTQHPGSVASHTQQPHRNSARSDLGSPLAAAAELTNSSVQRVLEQLFSRVDGHAKRVKMINTLCEKWSVDVNAAGGHGFRVGGPGASDSIRVRLVRLSDAVTAAIHHRSGVLEPEQSLNASRGYTSSFQNSTEDSFSGVVHHNRTGSNDRSQQMRLQTTPPASQSLQQHDDDGASEQSPMNGDP